MVKKIAGRPLNEWIPQEPLLKEIIETKEVFWNNPSLEKFEKVKDKLKIHLADIHDAEDRLKRFAPYLSAVFPETKPLGKIESPLVEITNMKKQLEKFYVTEIPGKLLLKCDHALPIAGSIKARGGIYEVLKYAENLALDYNMLSLEDDYSKLAGKKYRDFFSKFSISVGSTGNLGLSIGIISSSLGFNVSVHMSKDAKKWKKELLREKGVNVIEHETDFNSAVEEGRKQCKKDLNCHFIDDENSRDLFLGYSVAALGIKEQLASMNITVDEDHPLFVYLPCGVGGGPGGITFGLKQLFGDNVHCIFAEPTHSPSMLIGLLTDLYNEVSVFDFGIDNQTEADGLAVGRTSTFVGKMMKNLISGTYTIEDKKLFAMLALLIESENLHLEPSALAGMMGPLHVASAAEAMFDGDLRQATHIVWSTGGSLVPSHIMNQYYDEGKRRL